MKEFSDYQHYIAKSRYSRYLPNEERRETWKETVTRYCDFFKKRNECFPYEEMFNAIYNLEDMPSMRCLMTAGPALDRDNAAGYNCSYVRAEEGNDDPGRGVHPALYSAYFAPSFCPDPVLRAAP